MVSDKKYKVEAFLWHRTKKEPRESNCRAKMKEIKISQTVPKGSREKGNILQRKSRNYRCRGF